MQKKATSFQVVNLNKPEKGETAAAGGILEQPVLVSFPYNMPLGGQLKQMKFNMYEEDKDGQQAPGRVKKRVLKSAYKALRYEASSMHTDNKLKSQTSDYYIGVFDSAKNKCYALPVDAAYQMSQTIEGFQANFGVQNDIDVKNMTYYDQKKLQIGTFGTGKAQRKLASVMANQVDDGNDQEATLKSKRAKGTHDGRLHSGADHVAASHGKVKKEAQQSMTKRKTLYGKAALLPKEILKQLPFKNTCKALRKQDKESLREFLCGFVATIAEKTFQYNWPTELEEQQATAQSLVYLDALIRLYRMPPQFEFSMTDLSEKFKNIPEGPLTEILQKFCRITVSDRHSQEYMRGARKSGPVSESGSHFKFMKSKEGAKTLTLTLIGLVVHVSTQGKSRGYFLERILKKNASDMKSFFTELGMLVEPCKRADRETGEEVDDIWVSFSSAVSGIRRRRQPAEEVAQEAAAEEGQQEEE